MISVHFQGKPFNITVLQVYVPTGNAEEAELERFCEDLLSSGHRSIFIPIPKKCSPKECSNYRTVALISHASKVMLKILQARLQQYVNHELPDVQAGFRKSRGTRDQIVNICWIIKKAREFQKKKSISALLTMPKPSTMWITINCGKFWRRWECQTTLSAFWETCMQVRKNS